MSYEESIKSLSIELNNLKIQRSETLSALENINAKIDLFTTTLKNLKSIIPTVSKPIWFEELKELDDRICEFMKAGPVSQQLMFQSRPTEAANYIRKIDLLCKKYQVTYKDLSVALFPHYPSYIGGKISRYMKKYKL